MNRQPVIIVAVTNKEMRDRLSRMNAEIMGKDVDPFYNAPVVLIVLADKAAPTYLRISLPSLLSNSSFAR